MTEAAFLTPDPDLPDEIPIFPLSGVLLLPRGSLPLNIFEPRYLAMVEDALKTNRLIGMIQPRAGDDLFQTGCAGKIFSFTETDDNRYLITLKGVSRFRIAGELPPVKGGYRRVLADWSGFRKDIDPAGELNIDRRKLTDLLRSYFDMEGMNCDWDAIENASDDRLITCLAMICPLNAGEKQALLEAPCCKTRADLFIALLEMATRDSSRKKPEKPRCH
jgi:Lon protease-like protein